MSNNPRRANSAKRNKIRQILKDRGDPCHICKLPIDYSLPPGHPMSFEVDEITPVSRYWEGGYKSAKECALDIDNCAPAHRICNQRRGNKTIGEMGNTGRLTLPLSRMWCKAYDNAARKASQMIAVLHESLKHRAILRVQGLMSLLATCCSRILRKRNEQTFQ